MAELTPLENIMDAINMEEPPRVPLATLEQEFAVKTLGILYRDYATDAETIAKTQLFAIRRYSLDFAWIHSDDWIEYEAMGNKVRYFDDAVPTCEEYAVKSPEDADRLELPDPRRDGRMPMLLKAVERLADELKNRVMICGRVAAPFTGMLLLRGLEAGLKDLYMNKALAERLMEVAYKVAREFAEAQILAGAHALWIGDCMATSRVVPPRFQEAYVYPYQKKLINDVKKAGGVAILFTDERRVENLVKESMGEPDVLAVGTGVRIGDAKRLLGESVCLFGNVDPVRVLLESPRGHVTEAVKECIAQGAPGGGFILATGECTCRNMPEANMYAMVEAAHRYGRYEPRTGLTEAEN
ncbi:MAG: uroporphyrinogen decarboxylase family protein [Candidatus Bathyarchaeia archaeon]